MKERKLKLKPVEDKTYLTPQQFKRLKGTVEEKLYTYWPEKKIYRKSLKLIRGVAEAKRKAKTYVLATNVGKVNEMYLMQDGRLSNDKKDAIKFYHGFDNPINRKRFWKEQTGLDFHVCNF